MKYVYLNIIICVMAYVLSDFARNMNAVLMPFMAHDLNITISNLGIITSLFYLAFVVLQIPCGIVLDHVGPQKLQIFLLPLSALGAFISIIFNDFYILALGRLLIGAGFSMCLITAFKVVLTTFPQHKIPTFNGIVVAFGDFGGALATTPLIIITSIFGWRVGYIILFILLIFLCAYSIFLYRTTTNTIQNIESNISSTLKQKLMASKPIILYILTSPIFWLATITLSVASAYQGFWAVYWLREYCSIEHNNLSTYMLQISISTILGSIILGKLSAFLLKRNFLLEHVIAGFALIFIIIQFLISEMFPNSKILWMLFAFFGTGGLLSYSMLGVISPNSAGIANSIFNMLAYGLSFCTQFAFGILIDYLNMSIPTLGILEAIHLTFRIFLTIQSIIFIIYIIKVTYIKQYLRINNNKLMYGR